jgi:hypothetical protein
MIPIPIEILYPLFFYLLILILNHLIWRLGFNILSHWFCFGIGFKRLEFGVGSLNEKIFIFLVRYKFSKEIFQLVIHWFFSKFSCTLQFLATATSRIRRDEILVCLFHSIFSSPHIEIYFLLKNFHSVGLDQQWIGNIFSNLKWIILLSFIHTYKQALHLQLY